MKNLLFLLVFIHSIDLMGQPDTMVVYNVKNQTIDFIMPVPYDSTSTFENTSFSVGALGRKVPLNLEPPVNNLVEGTHFTDIDRAELFLDVTTYPARTAVKLFAWNNDTLSNRCSGTMISEKLVLTAAHCLMLNSNWRQDSILAAPAFDNGSFQDEIPTSTVENYYLFKTYYDRKGWDDIALLELRDPIGFETGWQGIAYNSDPSFFSENVFHKFSYPAIPSPFDTTKIYNGDTLYYNYGLIDYFTFANREVIGLPNGHTIAVPGKSGSSLFYTDNHEYFTLGVLNFAFLYRHYLIDQNVFYQLKNIIENHATYVNERIDETYPVVLYPNPATDRVTVEFFNPDNQNLTLTVYDMKGRLVRIIKNITGNRLYLHRNGLPSGIYIVRLYDNTRILNAKQIVFK